jgi:hypothetical protein
MKLPPVCPECQDRPVYKDDFLCGWCRADRDGTSHQRDGSVRSVEIEHYDERTAPPDRILNVGRVGEVVFLDLLQINKEDMWTQERSVRAVSGHKIGELVRALQALGWKITVGE